MDRCNEQGFIQVKYRDKEMIASNNPPLKADGKPKNYMQFMKELWDEMGYAGLNISKQNLRNQAAYVEKSLGDVSEDIRNIVSRRGIEEQESDETDSGRENQFISGSEILNSQYEEPTQLDLHTSTNISSQEANELIDLASPLYDLIVAVPGDFSSRLIDTRTKEQPTRADIQNINDACGRLLRSKTTGSPHNDPFSHLWAIDCILYAVVAAFLVNKGWKKERSGNSRVTEKDKDVLEKQVKEIRRKLAIAKAELDRIKKNGRITRERVKEPNGAVERMQGHIGRGISELHGKRKVKVKEVEESVCTEKKE